MASASISPNTASNVANALPCAVVMSIGSSTATMPAPRGLQRLVGVQEVQYPTGQTVDLPDQHGVELSRGESISARQPARSSGLLCVAETPSSRNTATTCQPRAAAYCSAASTCRSMETEASCATLMRA